MTILQPILSRRLGRKRSRKRPPVAVRPNRTVARYYPSHTIDKEFTVAQTVVNGEWVESGKTAVVNESLAASWTTEKTYLKIE
jgi:hypothetical protein